MSQEGQKGDTEWKYHENNYGAIQFSIFYAFIIVDCVLILIPFSQHQWWSISVSFIGEHLITKLNWFVIQYSWRIEHVTLLCME